MTQPCPRQKYEATMQVQQDHVSHWRDDGTCSYCGSIKPEDFLDYVRKGYEVGTTDKNYKAYIQSPNPTAGEPCIDTKSTHAHEGYFLVTEANIKSLPTAGPYGGRGMSLEVGDWTKISKQAPWRHHKFYFQHLSSEQQEEFIKLVNDGTMKFQGGFGFYVLPFFCKKAK